MDDFNRTLLETAYETVKKWRKREVTVKNVRRQMESHWLVYRDGLIAKQAARIQERMSRTKLIGLAEAIADRVYDLDGLYWEIPDDEDALAEFSAWGLAVLCWLRQEMRGRVQVVNVTDDEIAAWLAEQEANQPPPQKRSCRSKGNAPRQLCLWGGA